MRWILIAPLACAGLFAQAPADVPEKPQATESTPQEAAPFSRPPGTFRWPEKPKEVEEKLQQALKGRAVAVELNNKAVLAPGQACAIPLKNVLTEASAKVDEKMVIPVPKNTPDKYPTKEVSPPAPSCDDIKR